MYVRVYESVYMSYKQISLNLLETHLKSSYLASLDLLSSDVEAGILFRYLIKKDLLSVVAVWHI
jgi:hypothetical protein